MAGREHRLLAILLGLGVPLAVAIPAAEADSRGATTNLQIPHIDVPRVVPHTTPPGGVRDPNIPAHRLKVVTIDLPPHVNTLRRVLLRMNFIEAMELLIVKLEDVEKTDDFLQRFDVDPEA